MRNMSHKIENINKERQIIKKNEMEILELKSITEMKKNY